MKSKGKKIGLSVLVIFAALLVIGAVASGSKNNPSGEEPRRVEAAGGGSSAPANTAEAAAAPVNTVDAPAVSAFDGDCGIAASAEMGKTIIGLPQLSISITNTTDKEISAIQFYSVPLDVYGEEIKSWSSQNKLYTDTAIAAGASTTISYQLIEDSVKTMKLYVYSVYFSDGTEWGNREATKSTILQQGMLIDVAGES